MLQDHDSISKQHATCRPVIVKPGIIAQTETSFPRSGAGLKEAKEMIGHADMAMTDRYSHLPPLSRLQLQKRPAAYYAGGGVSDTP